MSAFKKTCAAAAIAGGLVLAAGPAGAATVTPVADSGSGDTGSSLPATGSGVLDGVTEFGCAFITGITGSGASVIGSSVPDLPGCS
ncbi:hypothetical protein AB0L57_25925 [Nocardia sp. NPDC052254]|uniref:hypothetical protein n=1 Tax=Nocardia sp. NPDC052254 TaxID=3155681 RepID=UPI0034400733